MHFVDGLRFDQVAGQRAAEQVGECQLRVSVLGVAPDLRELTTRDQRHQRRERGLAAPRRADDEQPLVGDQVQERQEHVGRVRIPRAHHAFAGARRAAEDEIGRVAHDRLLHDPAVRAAQDLDRRLALPRREDDASVLRARPALFPRLHALRKVHCRRITRDPSFAVPECRGPRRSRPF